MTTAHSGADAFNKDVFDESTSSPSKTFHGIGQQALKQRHESTLKKSGFTCVKATDPEFDNIINDLWKLDIIAHTGTYINDWNKILPESKGGSNMAEIELITHFEFHAKELWIIQYSNKDVINIITDKRRLNRNGYCEHLKQLARDCEDSGSEGHMHDYRMCRALILGIELETLEP